MKRRYKAGRFFYARAHGWTGIPLPYSGAGHGSRQARSARRPSPPGPRQRPFPVHPGPFAGHGCPLPEHALCVFYGTGTKKGGIPRRDTALSDSLSTVDHFLPAGSMPSTPSM